MADLSEGLPQVRDGMIGAGISEFIVFDRASDSGERPNRSTWESRGTLASGSLLRQTLCRAFRIDTETPRARIDRVSRRVLTPAPLSLGQPLNEA
jgi:hypothetical protein